MNPYYSTKGERIWRMKNATLDLTEVFSLGFSTLWVATTLSWWRESWAACLQLVTCIQGPCELEFQSHHLQKALPAPRGPIFNKGVVQWGVWIIISDIGNPRAHTSCQAQKKKKRLFFIKMNLGQGMCSGSKGWRKKGINSTDWERWAGVWLSG